MNYRYLFIDVLVRIILLTATCFILAFEYVMVNDIVINFNLLALIIFQVILFVRSSNRINRDLQSFFQSIRNEDSTLSFPRKFRNKSFKQLYQSLTVINKMIRDIKLENKEQNQYFQTITEHISVGLISFNSKGDIKLLNQAAKNLLNLKGTISLDSFDRIEKGFSTILNSIKPSEQKLVKLKTSGLKGEEMKQLLIRATALKFRNESIKIVSLQDIRNELDAKELEAWQNVIRVLTHEMMNSTGPIKSTTNTLIEFIEQEGKPGSGEQKNVSSELFTDVLKGLKIIEERSEGLEMFVKHFRKFTLLPKPDFQKVRLNEIFHNLKVLFDEDIHTNKIVFKIRCVPVDLCIGADKKLIEQLFINLLKNSIYYLQKSNNPLLEIYAHQRDNSRIEVSVKDNGQGIQPAEIEKIFIPFYTTREEGSGIGLSLSRQIMRMHGGTIDAYSEPEKHTVFKLRF